MSLIDDPNQDTPTPPNWTGGRDFQVTSQKRGHISHENSVVVEPDTDESSETYE